MNAFPSKSSRPRFRAWIVALVVVALHLAVRDAGAFTLGPATRRIPSSPETQAFFGVGSNYSSSSFKSSSDAFSDQTQTRWRNWIEGGVVPSGSPVEYFARVGMVKLRIKDAVELGDKSDLTGTSPYFALGTRIHLFGSESMFVEDVDAPSDNPGFRVTAVFTGSFDGPAESSNRIRTGNTFRQVTISVGDTYSAAAGLIIEKPLPGGWRGYAAPVATYSIVRERGRDETADISASTTYKTKIPVGAVMGIRYTNSLKKDLQSGLGMSVGLEAGWVDGPSLSAYLSQIY